MTIQKEQLLASVISKEISGLGSKMEFWGQDKLESGGTLWESKNSITLEQALSCINPESLDFQDSNTLQTLYALGWEFVWGQSPPEIVQEMRQDLLSRSRASLPLTELELLWLRVIAVDTDMF